MVDTNSKASDEEIEKLTKSEHPIERVVGKLIKKARRAKAKKNG